MLPASRNASVDRVQLASYGLTAGPAFPSVFQARSCDSETVIHRRLGAAVEAISKWWSAYSRAYDQLWNGPLSERLADIIVELAGPPSGWTVDVGAGTGLISARLAAAGHRLVCIDAELAMVRQLHDRVPGAVAVVGSIERLPLRRGAAHTVIATNVLHLHRDPFTALDTLAALVGPGGALICSWPVDAATPGAIARRERACAVPPRVVALRLVVRWAFGVAAWLCTDVRRNPAAVLDRAVRRVATAHGLEIKRVNLFSVAQAIVVLRPTVLQVRERTHHGS